MASMWSGNIGEWGEAFVLLQLLAHNKLYSADVHGKKIDGNYSLVEAMMRTETSGITLVMEVDDKYIIDHIGSNKTLRIPKSEFSRCAHSLFEHMQTQGQTASHPEKGFLKEIGLEGIKASSSVKSDISARIYESYLATHITRNFSIKCVIGSKPSMANASKQSYIDYVLPSFDEWKRDLVMNVPKRGSWVVNRVKTALSLVDEPPVPIVRNRVFNRNLLKCYWRAPEVVGYGLLYGQCNKGKKMIDSISDIKSINPAGYPQDELDDYEDALRNYLRAIVMKLVPNTPWVGPSEVDGYLLATNDEEVLAYQISRQRSFEDYLLLHTSWDTPSTTRHPEIGTVWQRDDGEWMLTLNCAIRYDVNEYNGPNKCAASIKSEQLFDNI